MIVFVSVQRNLIFTVKYQGTQSPKLILPQELLVDRMEEESYVNLCLSLLPYLIVDS